MNKLYYCILLPFLFCWISRKRKVNKDEQSFDFHLSQLYYTCIVIHFIFVNVIKTYLKGENTFLFYVYIHKRYFIDILKPKTQFTRI